MSMLTTAIYNMADTFFVSQLGTSAAGAVESCFPDGADSGGGLYVGHGLRRHHLPPVGPARKQEANRSGIHGFFYGAVFGLLLTVTGLSWGSGLMRLLGATETILPYAQAYAQYISVRRAGHVASFCSQ